ncbi:hypothetical protein RR46_06166 [Papilio xuthus]|uniref:Uncharacterized protein n=1 Tax=Papilio xuthus TaxID=66420 RepID=A0A194QBS5_PAPXU|nr:hypothetical protein RR46_06166 [Papilio xuthus]
MSLSSLLLFTSFAIVSTRNVHQVTTSYRYIESKPSYSDEYKNVFDPNEDRETISNYEYQSGATNQQTQENHNQRQEHVNSYQELNQSHKKDATNGPVFTNINRHQYNNNVKYIKRLDEEIDPDIIIFKDNIDDQRQPFTNKRTQNNTKYKINVNTVPIRKVTSPSKVPEIHGSTKEQYTTESYSDRTRTSDKVTNVTKVSNTRNNTKSVKEIQETTPVGFELDDRVAFNGDKCATGQAKVLGKCVPKQD